MIAVFIFLFSKDCTCFTKRFYLLLPWDQPPRPVFFRHLVCTLIHCSRRDGRYCTEMMENSCKESSSVLGVTALLLWSGSFGRKDWRCIAGDRTNYNTRGSSRPINAGVWSKMSRPIVLLKEVQIRLGKDYYRVKEIQMERNSAHNSLHQRLKPNY